MATWSDPVRQSYYYQTDLTINQRNKNKDSLIGLSITSGYWDKIGKNVSFLEHLQYRAIQIVQIVHP